MPLRYAELHPIDLQSAIDRKAPAIIAWGALEWHGDHLPLGLDGIVAEHFAEELAERVQGVLLPTIWLPMTTLPHKLSLQVDTSTFKAIVRETIDRLSRAGFESVMIVTGHYAQGHLCELFAEAIDAMNRGPVRVFAGPPLSVLGDDDLLDHAGEHETAQLLAIRPDLVRLEALPNGIQSKRDAVLGQDPHQASAEAGQALLDEALKAWTKWHETATQDGLRKLYLGWLEDLKPYRDKFYRDSWEQAITDWWATK